MSRDRSGPSGMRPSQPLTVVAPSVCIVPIVLKKLFWQKWTLTVRQGEKVLPILSGQRWRGHRDQLGELAEVLGGGGEGELVLRSVRAPEAQAIKL